MNMEERKLDDQSSSQWREEEMIDALARAMERKYGIKMPLALAKTSECTKNQEKRPRITVD